MISRLKQSPRGVTAIEAVLVLPLILLLTFGVMEYGWIFLKQQEIINAARHGAREAALPDASAGDVQASVANVMTTVGLGGSGYALSFNPADFVNAEPGDSITATITLPYENIELTGFALLPIPQTLRADATMAKEGP